MTTKRAHKGQYELPFDDLPDAPHIDEHSDQKALRVEEQDIIAEAFRILEERHRHGDALTSPDATRAFLRIKLAEARNEVLGCVFLDNRHRVIATEDIFLGTIDGASVHPRVIVQRVIEHNAAAVILYHNHPSGVAEPSQADIRITERIKTVLAVLDTKLLDHIVVSVEGYTSLAERGLM
jgi:DNA repair protein RadC